MLLSKNFFDLSFCSNASFPRKNYFNVLDVAKAVVMPLSEGHLAKTELTFLKQLLAVVWAGAVNLTVPIDAFNFR